MELQGRVAELTRQGLGLAAVSYDPVAVLADFSTRRGITFPLLSDPGSATIKRYGIFNTTVPETNQQSYGIPFPGTFMLNTQGVVTSRFFEQAYQERTTVGSIMARLGNKRRRAGDHHVVAAARGDLVCDRQHGCPGTQFSLVLECGQREGSCVRARRDRVQADRAVGEPQPGLVSGRAVPQSEDYHFKPLNEHVQVYQRPFRIVQDVLIDPSPQGLAALKDVSSLTIKGVLNYQACDDKLCFTPQSVPLTWTVTLRQLDRERARP